MNVSADYLACDASFPGLELLRLAEAAIARTRLDLTGLRVLTEAAVGYRRVTPIIAALAGAERVYAVGRDSVQASRREAEEQTAYFARLARVEERVTLLPTRLQAPLETVDIVTDLPGVRPIDETVLRSLASSTAVSLMRGAAHWRAADVDAATCRRRGIPVAGVDEEAIGLYRFLPLVILADLLDLGVAVAGSTVVLVGAGAGYVHVAQGLQSLNARVLVAAPDTAGRVALFGGDKIGGALMEEAVLGRLASADALVLCPQRPDDRSLAAGTQADAARVASAAPHLAVTGIGAEADLRALAGAGLRCRGADVGSASPFDLLPAPVIELHTAGLGVAAVMACARRRGSSPPAAEQLAAAEAFAELLPRDLCAARR